MLIIWTNLVLVLCLISKASSGNIFEDLDYEDFSGSNSGEHDTENLENGNSEIEEHTIKTLLPKYLNEKSKTIEHHELNVFDLLSMLNLQNASRNSRNEYNTYEFKRDLRASESVPQNIQEKQLTHRDIKNAGNKYYSYVFENKPPRVKRESETDAVVVTPHNLEPTQEEEPQNEDNEQAEKSELNEGRTQSEVVSQIEEIYGENNDLTNVNAESEIRESPDNSNIQKGNNNADDSQDRNNSAVLTDSTNSNNQSNQAKKREPRGQTPENDGNTSEVSLLSADVNNFQDGNVNDSDVSSTNDPTATSVSPENQHQLANEFENSDTMNNTGTLNKESEAKIPLTSSQLNNLQMVLSENFGVNSNDSKPVANFSLEKSKTDEKPVVVIVYNCSCNKESQNKQDGKLLEITGSSEDKAHSSENNGTNNTFISEDNNDNNENFPNTRRLIVDNRNTDDLPVTTSVVSSEYKKLSNAALENSLLSKCRSLLGLQLDNDKNENDTEIILTEEVDNLGENHTKSTNNANLDTSEDTSSVTSSHDDSSDHNADNANDAIIAAPYTNENLHNLASDASDVLSNIASTLSRNTQNRIENTLQNGLMNVLRKKRNIDGEFSRNKPNTMRRKRDLINHINEALRNFFQAPSSGLNTVLKPFSDQDDENRTKREVDEDYTERRNKWYKSKDYKRKFNNKREPVFEAKVIDPEDNVNGKYESAYENLDLEIADIPQNALAINFADAEQKVSETNSSLNETLILKNARKPQNDEDDEVKDSKVKDDAISPSVQNLNSDNISQLLSILRPVNINVYFQYDSKKVVKEDKRNKKKNLKNNENSPVDVFSN